jgi:opacity protein-like surface antigen
MFSIARKAFIAALLAGAAAPAFAADPYYPPADPAPPQVVYQDEGADYGGWYLRGDVDYHWSDFRGADYVLYTPVGASNSFDFGDIEDSWSLGGGVGYQINKHLRTDLTGDWMFEADFRGQTSDATNFSVDTSKVSSFLLLANAYVDIGTWRGITPYVGAGVGGAWVKWDDLNNTITPGGTITHRGAKSWRFAYALSAGASYCLTDNLKFDAGYRFSHVKGGKMFEFAADGAGGAGPGYDKGFHNHEVRGGLRYQFGKSDCAEPEQIAYEPVPEPVYTK